MVDLMCLRQLYKRYIITEIKWIDGDSNPINIIIKVNACNVLRNFINMNTINLNTKEWVERGWEVKKKLSNNFAETEVGFWYYVWYIICMGY